MKKPAKKFSQTALCLILIAVSVVIIAVNSGAAETKETPDAFVLSDVTSSPYKNEILSLINDGTLPVFISDGKAYFYPSLGVTREYIAAAVAKAGGLGKASASQTTKFSDSGDISEENAAYVASAVSHGLVPVYSSEAGGSGELSFYPGRNVSRSDAAYIFSKMIASVSSSTEARNIADAEMIPKDSYISVISAVSLGIMNTYGDGTFRPNETITREELAAALYKIKHL